MKEYWGSGGITPLIFILELDGGESSASRSGRFTPRERAPINPRVGGWQNISHFATDDQSGS
jgi:hypothetical protein